MEQTTDFRWYYGIVEQAHNRLQEPNFDYPKFVRENMEEFKREETTPDRREEIAVQVSETIIQKMGQVDTMDTLPAYLDFVKVLDHTDPSQKSFMRTCVRMSDSVTARVLTPKENMAAAASVAQMMALLA